MIEAVDIGKRGGYRDILDGVNLNIDRGEALVLLGPNGAGKTSLLRILAGLSHPDRGKVTMDGGSLDRGRIGFLSHRPFLYEGMTAEENLLFFGRLYGLEDPGRRSGELLAQVGLSLFREELVRNFSRGMQQRLDVARAIVHRPLYLLLDEPYTAMDQEGCALLDHCLAQHLAQKGGAIVCTHDLSRVPAWGNRLAFLRRGKKVAELAGTVFLEEDVRLFYARHREEKR